jgi:hypothetical protein
MDGVPVVVFAFADLDGDGVVGPTDADPQGAADDACELQESDFVVGRQIAIFQNGVATGSVAVSSGAPASAGGLSVVLTAAAYVGPFTTRFAGNVPDGPPVATLLPFVPRFDPNRVVEGGGRGGRAGPETRLGVQLEPAFEPPVGDPVLGTPLALPTNGSSPTIDRATVVSGPFSRARFVRPSVAAGFPLGIRVPLFRDGAGTLVEELTAVDVPDDGPGGAVHVRLVSVDVLDNVTDPPAGAVATLVAGAGVLIASPDADGDPSRETVPLASAAGVDVALDDAGGAGDSGIASAVTVVVGGAPVESLPVHLTPGTTAPGTPVIDVATVLGASSAFVAGCPASKTLVVVVADPDGDVSAVTAAMTINGAPAGSVDLAAGVPVSGLPAGQAFSGPLGVSAASPGTLSLSVVATDVAGHHSAPALLSFPVVSVAVPVVVGPALAPTTVTVRAVVDLLVSTWVTDDCGVKRVSAEIDRGRGFRRLARLNDRGRRGDRTAGDGVFTATRLVRLRRPGSFAVRVVAKNRLGATTTSAPVALQAVP